MPLQLPFVSDESFLRLLIFLIVSVFSYILLSRKFSRGASMISALVIGLIGMYYSSINTDLWNIFIYSLGGFIILSLFALFIFFHIAMSFPSSGMRRSAWILFGILLYILIQQQNLNLPEPAIIIFIAVFLVMVIFDRQIYALIERRRIRTWFRRR